MTLGAHSQQQPNPFGLPLLLLTLLLTCLSGCAVVAVGAAGGAMAAHDRRTAETILDDQGIETRAYDQLYGDPELDKKIHTNVTSYNRVVLLTGEVVSEAARKRAIEIVRSISKVKRVHNELRVADLTVFSERSQDSWLTTKVKTKMLTTDGFDANRVKVVTENDTVYLMGLVTPDEGQIAADIASTTDGVNRVVTLYEYVDEADLKDEPPPTKAPKLRKI